ncbi:hypothetical protein D4764_17G0000640 [Takifugu flavidus]|uniref:Uncharacterized protein n=1 Tax=Takifugu flavidus TaxID=433684 RepID=A0A5C6NVJ1_9TELE|nr:hypothetical protein D4764_17G0000640 [Takifugu flavidus]
MVWFPGEDESRIIYDVCRSTLGPDQRLAKADLSQDLSQDLVQDTGPETAVVGMETGERRSGRGHTRGGGGSQFRRAAGLPLKLEVLGNKTPSAPSAVPPPDRNPSLVLRGLAPSYLEELVTPDQPNRPLRSQNAGLLVVPRVSNGGLWNQLPVQADLLTSDPRPH